MKSPSEHAPRRAANWLRRELAKLIQGHLRDPDLGAVTITDVDLRRNYSSARIYVELEGDDAETTLATLNKAAGHLRSQLSAAHGGHLRTVPQLRFYSNGAERRLRRLIDDIGAR